MGYHLEHKKLDISGPKGNVFAILGIARKIVNMVESVEAGKEWIDSVIESSNDYEEILREVIKKTGITLVSPHPLPIDPELYTITEDNYL